ncbi:MAG: gephyrin-like molybdotransferase Glp [Deltaproteobacteria bacterium]
MKPFFQLISADQAYDHIGNMPVVETENVDSRSACGRVVAEDISSAENVPHFERSNMDGYAVRACDTFGASETSPVSLPVSGRINAGEQAAPGLSEASAMAISTGAMMPAGADAVVIVENTEEPIEGTVLIKAEAVPGQNLVRLGEDLKIGDQVFQKGRRLSGGDVGALTGIGVTTFTAYRLPRVGIIVTGDEIVEPGEELRPGQVRNVNQYALGALARSLGAIVVDYGVVGDRKRELCDCLAEATTANDCVFVSGGSSMGTRDLTMAAIKTLPEARALFHGVAIAPGKPTILASCKGSAVMGLPGNPAAAAVVFTLFGSTLIRVLGGEPLQRVMLTRPRTRALLASAVGATAGRENYVRVKLEPGTTLATAVPLRGKSAALSTIAGADGMVCIKPSSEGLQAGEEVEVLLF